MNSKEDLLVLINRYQEDFPGENKRLSPILSFLEKHEGASLYSRSNFNGHITASAFIYHHSSDALVLIKHTTLNRWLQPGGHVETEDASLLYAALREAEEETTIPASSLVPVEFIFDIDSHEIPANVRKNEPTHTHHDIRYLFLYNAPMDQLPISGEVSGCQWIFTDELKSDPTFGLVVEKLERLRPRLSQLA